MIFAYVLISTSLWKRKCPGEQTDQMVKIQLKSRKKVHKKGFFLHILQLFLL